ncbi:hypothetical protein BDV33DRAFT_202677 [Aspergillus novoparasiticus]|uniref:Carrier domain-containing protein n=1 Tax=Aspergillus novoparasiticus TaxID=986946 RepID=A0A5N6EUE1_9EURO|nr:hypothetical protein BDV33DRAFT_202677 [Aspergillus novoparasiticus]
MDGVNGTDGPHGRNESARAAIVGMSCRLPGMVDSPSRLWELCSRARSAWSEVPESRFNAAGYYHPTPGRAGSFNYKGGHWLDEDVGLFDAPFFNVTLKEAQSMDPQQRILLECTYEALENAGLTKSSLSSQRVGVFIGGSTSEYNMRNTKDPENIPMFQATGGTMCMQANRISYYFNLKGPSVSVDTACSSSLSALHLACQSLKSGESEIAIVGACHLNLIPEQSISMALSRLLADSGRCYAFDHRASGGFGRGEGCGCIVIKPLDAAIEANDAVRAVIVGTGVNQDGRTTGITQPNSGAQEELIRAVYESAGIDPSETGYVEAHGTGTKIGDPIEASALHAVFGGGRTSRRPLYIGSVKSNVGHTESVSGVISVIKTAMMLEKELILPNCNFEKPNPAIPLQEWNLKVPTKLIPWPRNKRYASINNFGFGGSNAHAILTKAPPTQSDMFTELENLVHGNSDDTQSHAPTRRVYPISANDKQAFTRRLKTLETYLEQQPEAFNMYLMENLAYTLGERRTAFPWRAAVSAASATELIGQITSPNFKPERAPEEPVISFVFTGQGAQWHGMGKELLARYALFEKAMKRADQCIKKLGAEFSIVSEITREGESSLLTDPCYSQSSCTAIQLSLTQLLKSWGVVPTAVVGHSSGEIAAAFAAEMLDFDDCMRIAYCRGAVAAKLRTTDVKGSMMAMSTCKEDAEKMIKQVHSGTVVVACINSDSSVTASGDTHAIDELQTLVEDQGLFNRKLRVDVAYHSHHMGIVSAPYLSLMGDIRPQESKIKFYSSLHGHQVQSSELNANYWVANLLSPVNFVGGLSSLLREAKSHSGKPVDTLIEIGPHSALEAPIRETAQECASVRNIKYLPCIKRKSNAVETMQQLAVGLFMRGLNICFGLINADGDGKGSKRPVLLTNMPKYPWDHSVKYWHESRWARSLYSRSFPRNDLLGSLSVDSDSIETKWRNVIRVDDHPWIRQHQAQGKNIYPFMGYVAMAIEALSQSARMRNVSIDNYCLREVAVDKALIIPEASTVEMMTTLRPFAEGTRASSEIWYEFRVSAICDGQEWMEHCRGLISGTREKEPNPIDGAREIFEKELDGKRRESMVDAPGMSAVDSEEMYGVIAASGMQYGDMFKGMSSIRASDHHATAELMVPNTSLAMPDEYESGHILHPATLDLCLQLMWPLVGYRGPGQKQLYLPTFIGCLYARCKTKLSPGDRLKLYGSRTNTLHPRRAAELNIVTTRSQDPSDVLIRMDNVKSTPLIDQTMCTDRPVKNQCYKVHETPCVDFLNSRFLGLLDQPNSPKSSELQTVRVLEQASFYLLEAAQNKLSTRDPASVKGHYHYLMDWIRETRHRARRGDLPLQTPDWLECSEEEREAIIEEARSMGAPGEMICTLGSLLPEILRREVDPSAVMREGSLLERYYQDLDSFRRSYISAASFIDKMADQKPHMNILEIGAGTGAATLPFIHTLGGGDTKKVPRFNRYDFTDVSDATLNEAKEKFKSWGGLLGYQKLDIARDPIQQGYEEHSYDLVIACHVLHLTPRLDVTLANVRKLLKPGGKLVLLEENGQQLRQFIYALLPEWWRSDDSRIDGPLLDKTSWDTLLRESGFSGLDLALDDYPGAPEQCGSLLVTTLHDTPDLQGRQVTIVCPEISSSFPVDNLARDIESMTGCSPEMGTLSSIDAKGKLCIFLGELDNPYLSQLDEARFNLIQNLLQDTSGLLWVIRPGCSNDSKPPESHLITGLARTVRSETSLPLVTLELQSGLPQPDYGAVKRIMDVFGASFGVQSSPKLTDREYSVKDGIIYVPRMVNDTLMDEFIHREAGRSDPELQSCRQDGRPLKLVAGEPGVLDTLHFTDDRGATSELPESHVEIQVEYIGLNFKDVMTAMGQMSKDTLGNECSGIVTRVGGDVEGLAKGDRVCAVCEGAFATSVSCPATSVWRVPDSMDLKTAATIPLIFCTAYYSLFDLGRLVQGEKILIHAAAGGVGQAAIMLANMVGADVFATVSTPEKKQFLMETYGVEEDRIFFSRDSSFTQHVKKATNGEGVDVVLNSLAGEMLRASWDCVAPFGRFIELGKKDILQNSRLEMSRFDDNVSFSSVDLTAIYQKRPLVMKRLLSNVFKLFAKGLARPVAPITSYSVSDVEVAFRSLQGGRVFGKSVIELQPDALVKVFPPQKPQVHLSPEASYIVVGGSGGLGRNIADWLSQHGAKHLVLLARSGDGKENVKRLIQRTKSEGVRIVAPRCDISNKADVRAAISMVQREMPPIRGVIFGAMVLRDCLFEKMQYDDYRAVISPKVDGLWNLHHTLKEAQQHLDFFVNLSSVSGVIGNRGQAAYAAASTFMSSFARAQLAAGYPYTNIDLGPVKGIGYLAERKGTVNEVLDTLETQGVEEEELHALLTGAISGKMLNTCNGHCITSLEIAASSQADQGPFWMVDPRFAHLVRASIAARAASEGDDEDQQTAAVPLATAVKKAGKREAAQALIVAALGQKMSTLLMVPLEDIVPSKSISSYGLDSLVAIEVRNWVFRELESYLQIMEIVSAPSLVYLADRVICKSKILQHLKVNDGWDEGEAGVSK